MPMLSMGHWAWKKLVVILLFVSYVEVCVLLLDRVLGKPRVPAGFWVSGDMCDALCLPSLGLPGPLTVVKDRDSSVSGLAELLRFFLPADKMIHSFIYSCVWKDHYGTTSVCEALSICFHGTYSPVGWGRQTDINQRAKQKGEMKTFTSAIKEIGMILRMEGWWENGLNSTFSYTLCDVSWQLLPLRGEICFPSLWTWAGLVIFLGQ